MKKNLFRLCLLFVLVVVSVGTAREYFPDLPDYQPLLCDFHMLTLFSDGLVWPTVRVDEAQREGLDAIALSDHIEYQPHKDDLPTHHSRPYEIAVERAKQQNLLLIRGAEITRDTPPGHYNAIFLSDIDPLDTPDFFDCLRAVAGQRAFLFWNHHTWKGVERGQWTETQDKMCAEDLLHGMEVANGDTYYPLAHEWCLRRNLTLIGNSDIHQPSTDYRYAADRHRTLTLVFARERTVESVEEALRAGRTAVWYENQVIGREAFLKPLFARCVTVSQPHYINENGVAFFEVKNNALVDFELKARGQTTPATIAIPAHSTVICKTKMPVEKNEATLSYTVANVLTEPGKGLPVEFSLLSGNTK